MKPVSIHPLSAFAGAGLLGFVLLAASAVQAPIHVQPFPDCTQGLVRVAGIPDPRQMVVIRSSWNQEMPTADLAQPTAATPPGPR